jgi:hypothetical protein
MLSFHDSHNKQLHQSLTTLLPIVITVLLRGILLLFFRTARRTARGARHNVVTVVGVCHALRLVFCASSRRFDLQCVASCGFCESSSTG